MTTPDPRDSSPAALPDLIKAFTGLPPLLGYGGLVLVAAMIILSISGTLPDILLAVPIVALIAFLIYAFMGHRFALQTRQAEMRHEEKMVELRAEERPSPVPTEVPGVSPSEGQAPPPAGRIAAGEWERRYLEHLLHLCGYPPSMALVDIREAGLGGQKLALERIFTTLDVPNPEGRREPAGKPPFLEPPDEGERRQREAVLTAMSRPENKRLVLLGAPGAGKSTLVSYLTLCLAGDHLRSERVNQSHLQQHGWQLGPLRLWPVRVILREYAARGLSQGQGIWDFMAADLSRPAVQLGGYVPYLKERLNEEGGILLLDGLDEVDKASQVRQALKTNVELFARNFPKVRVVVTSRPYAYGSGWELSGFQVTRLLPFSDEQIQAFIEQWYTVMGQQDGTLGPERAKTYREGLLRQVKNNRNLRELARHPLLLTMMVYIHRGREGGALPQRREELYRLCVILLLDLWRRSKTIPGQETKTLAEVLGVDTERLLEALAEVAFTAHRDQPDQEQTADIPGEILSGKLHKYKSKESRVSVDEIIEYVRDRAGLLEDHGRNADDTDDVYRFPHRTFQEYLAGLHLLKQNFPYDLARYASQDPGRWREALLLAAASQRTVPFTVWSLVAALCQQPPPRTLSDSQSPALWGAF
ncbi:MAG: NACHT domain-containing protein, partial [Chloroflexota bacterium]